MDYAIRMLLEKKLDIEVDMAKGDEDKRNSLKKKYVDICVALNKLNLTRVSKNDPLPKEPTERWRANTKWLLDK